MKNFEIWWREVVHGENLTNGQRAKIAKKFPDRKYLRRFNDPKYQPK